MHECIECGTMCDCDGEDTINAMPDEHQCIGEDCELNPHSELREREPDE